MWTSNHANIILCVYVRFTFKYNVDCCWYMDYILMMWGNRFADYQHDVCQVKKNYYCFGLEKPGCYRPNPLPKSQNKDKLIKCKSNGEGPMTQVMRPR